MKQRSLARHYFMPIMIIVFLLAFISPAPAAIQFVNVPANKGFPNAREAGSVRFACAPSQDELASHFASEGLRFDASLLRVNKTGVCHVHYVPTLRGFRAHPDSVPASQVFLDLDHKALLSRRTMQFGDSLDMAKTILSELPRPVSVTLSVPITVSSSYFENAIRRHFPSSAAHVWLRNRPVEAHQTWAQDYMKSGSAEGETRVLMPRRSFEGQPEYGRTFKGLLKSFAEKTWVRSKLAWEGGDLIFTHDPRDPSRLLLFFGDAARQYWGATLTGGEYGHVLATEFGADQAIYFGGITPHVDYFVSFLPEDSIALVATTYQEDFEVSRNALELLIATIAAPLPPVIERLQAVFATRESAFGENAPLARSLIAQARAEASTWKTPVSAEVYNRVESYIAENCSQDPTACLSEKRLPGLIEDRPEVLRGWVEMASYLRGSELLPRALLSIIESQIPGTPIPGQVRTEEKIQELKQMGYRVIRVPTLGADMLSETRWAGVSYVNAALIDHTLFVPVFGLGAPEQRILSRLRAQLPARYRVVPVFARHAQLFNGGVHCILAFIREPGAGTALTESDDREIHRAETTPAGVPQISKFTGESH